MQACVLRLRWPRLAHWPGSCYVLKADKVLDVLERVGDLLRVGVDGVLAQAAASRATGKSSTRLNTARARARPHRGGVLEGLAVLALLLHEGSDLLGGLLRHGGECNAASGAGQAKMEVYELEQRRIKRT